jgi:hypothetical protein
MVRETAGKVVFSHAEVRLQSRLFVFGLLVNITYKTIAYTFLASKGCAGIKTERDAPTETLSGR